MAQFLTKFCSEASGFCRSESSKARGSVDVTHCLVEVGEWIGSNLKCLGFVIFRVLFLADKLRALCVYSFEILDV